jgi:phosphoserine phosphatase
LKTVLVQIYRFKPEQELLNTMSLAFLRHGLKMILWSNRDQGFVGLPIIPLTRNYTDDSYLDFDDVKPQDWSRFTCWRTFIESLKNHYGCVDPTYDLNRCYRAAHTILDRLNPSLYLCWCGIEPWFAIPKELFRETGTPVLVWELGMLPNTLLLDRGGVAADSEWCGKPLPDIDTRVIERAKEYIATWHKKEIEFALNSGLTPKGQKLPRVLILGCMDIAAGVHRAQGSGPRTLPGYVDGIDIAMAVASCHDGVTVYRPHPREPAGPLSHLKDTKIIIDTESSLNTAILWADVVIGYGSKADYVALAMGKPFILAGIGFLTGKGCAYEALSKETMAKALNKAITLGRTADQIASYEQVIAWMLTQSHYNREAVGPCRQGVEEFVAYASLHANSTYSTGIVESVLSPIGREWLQCENGKSLPGNETAITIETSDPLGVVLRCFDDEIDFVVLDFDHTLLLGNSTELFISTARPRLLAEMIDKIVSLVSRMLTTKLSDRVHVLAIAILLPWTIPLWKRSSHKIVNERWNHPLWKLMRRRVGNRVAVVSNGFRILITAVLRAAVVPSGIDFLIIASDLRPKGRDIRTEGKVVAIERDLPDIVWDKTIGVTDSLEDRDLIERSKHGVLTLWPEPRMQPQPGYFPLRYVSRGKYPGKGYVRNFIFGQDFLVWLILFVTMPQDIGAVLLLFVSFYAIYEIGYYENDFKAAKIEEKPSLSGRQELYAHYPIEQFGWLWALIIGFIGCLWTNHGVATSAILTWICLLIVVRFCFFIYNRKRPEERGLYYLILQGLKNFGGIVVLAPTLTGLLLAAAHLFQHATTYMIYRCGGDKTLFPRALSRLVIFAIEVGVVYGVGYSLSIPHFFIALTWLLYQALVVERGGKRWTINRIIHGGFRQLRNKLKNNFAKPHST